MGDSLYGCDIAVAREIIPLRPATRLPGAPPFVRGLINIRGTIVTVIDLRMRLDPKRRPSAPAAPAAAGAGPGTGAILLVRRGERVVGMVVDRVEDVRTLSTIVDGADAGMKGSTAGIVLGVAASDDGTVVVLDLGALMEQVLLA